MSLYLCKGRPALMLAIAGVALIALPARSESQKPRFFAGSMNDKLLISVSLEESGKALRGSYAYLKIGKPIKLEGELGEGRGFTLREVDEKGTCTGIFKGEFFDKDRAFGQWSSPDGARGMPFEWLEVPVSPALAAKPEETTGEYGRLDQTAGIEVKLESGKIIVKGNAFWSPEPDSANIHIGEINGAFAWKGPALDYAEGPEGSGCKLKITFLKDLLIVTEDNQQCGGVNVTFNGIYRRLPPAAKRTGK